MNVRQKRLAQIKSEREPQIKFARRRLGHDEKNCRTKATSVALNPVYFQGFYQFQRIKMEDL